MSLPERFYVPLERDLIRLTGRDRQSFLQGMVTNDIAALTPGQGCYAFHLTSKGQILADCRIACLDESLLLDTEPGWGEPLAASLEHHLVMERVKIALSKETVYFVFGESYSGLETEGANRLEGEGLVVLGALGYFLYRMPAPTLPALTESAYEALRIEAGIPRGRVDFDEKTLAPETGQASRAIHYKKGCYIGQEVVARIDARGHTNRSLVRLILEQCVAPHTPIFVEAKEAGWVTSCAIGPALGVPVALGYVRNEFATPGTIIISAGTKGTIR
jgi:tRNA-modifying protein YgfZ